jgi:two-component system nitrogen regulation response regulator GlnG
MPTLLVVDDEPSILYAFRRVFREPEVQLITAATAREGIDIALRDQPDVVILDVNLPDMSGLDAFQRIHEADARTPVILITGHGTTDTAIEGIKLGALDYLFKPLDLEPLRDLVTSAFRISRAMRVPIVADKAPPASPTDTLVGRCPAMSEVYKAIGRVAPQDVTVLILGESGTGKELVARAIYQHSRRAKGPFLAINCAAIPETLLESELFGHEKGAFTGAERQRIGKFEQCSGGTLLLDEIGDMTPLTQSKILRVMQEHCFERVGGTELIRADIRLIAATNRDLAQLVAAGQFREDLYYRLSVFTIRLPPLRERGDDLGLLVDHFLRRFNRELGKNVHAIAPETRVLLKAHSWPGNLRELQSVIKQALLHASGPILAPEFLPASLRGTPAAPELPTPEPNQWEQFIDDRLTAGSSDLYTEWLRLTDKLLLTRVLRHTNGNQMQAARILGITRGTLRTRIRALGIPVEDFAEPAPDQKATSG